MQFGKAVGGGTEKEKEEEKKKKEEEKILHMCDSIGHLVFYLKAKQYPQIYRNFEQRVRTVCDCRMRRRHL